MRWNCPHCGVNLAISDEKIGSGWSFSRCYKCGGFGLIRRAEINLMKVDKAPIGENILLPEASEAPVMSQQATQNLERLLTEKPTIRPAARKRENADTVAPPAVPKTVTPPPMRAKPPVVERAPINAAPSFPNTFPGIPSPLPEISESSGRFRLLPAAIGVAGMLTIGSGVYLYVQGQNLWHSARANITKPATIAAKQVIKPVSQAENTVIVDSVQHSLMAPDRAQENQPISVRIRNGDAKLRSGPGTKYPIVGMADPQVRYEILGWKNDWFKVAPVRAARAVANANEYEISAWIRNDLVDPMNGSTQTLEQ
ncbi:MAG: hypothetical protein A2X94_11925 [Bdellovibrionales bacterium GWB1_55_8]|nr:MAG: hypothetical protein A2X94_11925 [Bdellovibrionales bacterium GWB1_55_8]